jgi:hypothetical protein
MSALETLISRVVHRGYLWCLFYFKRAPRLPADVCAL